MNPFLMEETQFLGPARAEYKFNPRRLVQSTVVGLTTRAVAVLCFLIAFDVFTPPGQANVDPFFKRDVQIVSFGAGVFFTVFGLMTFLHSYRNRKTRVRLYADAVAYSRGRNTTICHWDDVAEVWETKALIDNASTSSCKLLLTDGRTLKFTNEFFKDEDIDELQAVLLQETFEPLWRRTATIYENGGTVGFGPYRVSRDGLTWGNWSIWWNDIRNFHVDNPRRQWTMVTHQNRWLTVPFNKMPNVAVFLALMHGVLEYERATQAS